MKVEVFWMDGKRITIRCSATRVADGVLYLIQDKYPATDEPTRSIPLHNVREWLTDD